MRRRSVGAALCFVVAARSADAQTIIRVDDGAALGGDGASWATAFTHLQDALTVGTLGSEIRVAQGTYTPDQDEAGNVTAGDRGATFQLKNGVALMGGYAGLGAPDPDLRDIAQYETVLSGDLTGNDEFVGCTADSECDAFGRLCAEGYCIIASENEENSYHVLTGHGTDGSAILNGFTITSGNADGLGMDGSGAGVIIFSGSPTVTACSLVANSTGPSGVGGGMYNQDSNPGVTGCAFLRNSAAAGAGVQNQNSSPVVTNCRFEWNSVSIQGAGIHNNPDSSPTISGCTFIDNVASQLGGGMSNEAGTRPHVTRCDFLGNRANGSGGGMHNWSDSNPRVARCNFDNNTSVFGGAISNLASGLVVSDCTFTGNIALEGGGAIYNEASSPTVIECVFSGNSAGGDFVGNGGGGGMRNDNSSPTVTSCMFNGNSAAFGGGIDNQYGSRPNVVNCIFSGNSTDHGGGGMGNAGSSNPSVSNCTFTGNSANGSVGGGGMANRSSSNPSVSACTFSGNSANGSAGGGGMSNAFRSSPTVNNCTFSGNFTATVGGGMANVFDSTPAVTSCTFGGNTGTAGGGMYNSFNSNPMVTNSTFSGNLAVSGGGMYNAGSSRPAVSNCTMSGNSARSVGGGISNIDNAQPTVNNCILWGNIPDEMFNFDPSGDTPTFRFGNVRGGIPPGTIDGGGNIDADPLFVDADGLDNTPGTADDDLRLGSGSPCIDAGDNGAVPPGVTTELLGNRCFFDDSATDDTGIGTPPIVDMGAYEFGSVPCEPGDLDCDGDVDLGDFARLQGCFGATDPLGCNPMATSDLDGNGDVDLDDYVIFESNLIGPVR